MKLPIAASSGVFFALLDKNIFEISISFNSGGIKKIIFFFV